MAQNFKFDSDSDSDVISERTRSTASTPINQDDDGPNPYWYEFTEEEDEEEDREVLSKENRSANEIFSVFDKYDWSVTNSDFAEAQKYFVDLVSKARAHLEKFDIRKIVPLTDAPEEEEDQARSLWSILNDSVSEEDEMIDQGLRKSDGEESKPGYNRLVKLQEERLKFRKYLSEIKIAAKIAVASSQEVAEGELTESTLMMRLEDAWQGKRDKKVYGAQSCMNVIKLAEERGFKDVMTTGKVIYALLFIQEESRRSVSISYSLERLFDMLADVVKDAVVRSDCVETFDQLKVLHENQEVEDDSDAVQFKAGIVIPGGPAAVCSTLFTELRRVIQFTNLHDEAYALLVKKENELVDLVDLCFAYQSGRAKQLQLVKLLFLLVGYRSQASHALLMGLLPPRDKARVLLDNDIVKTITNLSNFPSQQAAQTGVLYRAYQHALVGEFQKGKDAILRSGISQWGNYADAEFSLLYNRVIAQLGLAAFATGKLQETNECLQKIFCKSDKKDDDKRDDRKTRVCSWNETMTIIGQNVPPAYEGFSSTARLACKELVVPPHFHISYDHLELAASVAAVVVDSVAEARRPYQRLNQSALTRRYKQQNPQHLVYGAPNATGEVVRAMTAALKSGDCKRAVQLLSEASAWQDFPTFGENASARDVVLGRLKEEALRVFCYTYACSFSSLSLKHLSERFALQSPAVKCIINQTLLDKESPLVAFWSEDEELLSVDRGNVTRLQHLVDNAANTVYDLSTLATWQSRGRGRGGRGGRGGRKV